MKPFYSPSNFSARQKREHAERFLQSYGNDHNVRFVFEGPARTDGKTVWLGDYAPEDETFLMRALAHGMHEMLHVTDTDMEAFRKACVNPLAGSIINVLEDVRIDTLGMARYPGYRVWRDILTEYLEEAGLLKAAADTGAFSLGELIAVWLQTELMAQMNVAWAERHHKRLRNALLARMNPETVASLLKISRATHTARTTDDVCKIARKILTQLQGLDAHSKENPEIDLFSEPGSESDASNIQELARAARQVRPVTPVQQAPMGSNAPTRSETCSDDSFPDWPDETQDPQLIEDAKLYSERFVAETAAVKRLARAFSHILTAPSRQALPERNGSTLTEDFIGRIAVNDNRLFLKDVPRKKPDADVVILLDRSGSMGLTRMTKAKAAVFSLMQALCDVPGIETTVAVFPGPKKTPIALVKKREDSAALFRKRFPGIGAFGATPLTQAVRFGIQTLKASRHANRLLFVMTDGASRADALEDLRDDLQAAGIESAFLNIDTDNPPLSENTVYVAESEEIAGALLKLVKATRFAKTYGR